MSTTLDMVQIQNGIKELREERSWTQGQLAAAARVSRQSINSIEKGRTVPSLELALVISRIFECPVDEIFWIDDSADTPHRAMQAEDHLA